MLSASFEQSQIRWHRNEGGVFVNILLQDDGFDLQDVVMFQTTAALGYGFDYVFTILERARAAGLQGDTLMAVQVTTTPEFASGAPTPLFSSPSLRGGGRRPLDQRYDVSADGRFVLEDWVESDSADEEPPTMQVIENWYEEFRDRE